MRDVHPLLASRVHQMAVQLDPLAIRVTQGLRTWPQQAALYAQGRTAPGQIVTNAPPGHSWHEFGLAVDIVPMENGQPDWTLSHPAWPRAVAVGESLGLIAGARWQHPDWPHFQLTGELPVSPDDRVRQVFLDTGVDAVWELTGLPTLP